MEKWSNVSFRVWFILSVATRTKETTEKYYRKKNWYSYECEDLHNKWYLKILSKLHQSSTIIHLLYDWENYDCLLSG